MTRDEGGSTFYRAMTGGDVQREKEKKSCRDENRKRARGELIKLITEEENRAEQGTTREARVKPDRQR